MQTWFVFTFQTGRKRQDESLDCSFKDVLFSKYRFPWTVPLTISCEQGGGVLYQEGADRRSLQEGGGRRRPQHGEGDSGDTQQQRKLPLH